jgi:hypothetical protein
MDNNFLAHDFHTKELEWCVETGTRLDFNQGLDARLVNEANGQLLAKCKWIRFIRFSCDNPNNWVYVKRAVQILRDFGFTGEIMCYVLVQDIKSALEVCEFLRSIKVDPFAQAYIDYSGNDNRTVEQKRFCRYVNQRAVFKTTKWEDYKKNASN